MGRTDFRAIPQIFVDNGYIWDWGWFSIMPGFYC